MVRFHRVGKTLPHEKDLFGILKKKEKPQKEGKKEKKIGGKKRFANSMIQRKASCRDNKYKNHVENAFSQG